MTRYEKDGTMADTTILLPIDTVTAAKYYAATEEERQKVQLLVRLLLRTVPLAPDATLSQLMDRMSDEAQTRGLTPAILEELLNDHE